MKENFGLEYRAIDWANAIRPYTDKTRLRGLNFGLEYRAVETAATQTFALRASCANASRARSAKPAFYPDGKDIEGKTEIVDAP
ncbi:MAG: hypothetical protein RLZZ338_4718 [Cyanobacteriota bacterium]